ncbi:hypothetical protein F2Q69_00012647 [Brassica cretica]|uniref:Uncharacterized protein n=2 Tax=Brassica TaxID=3705 RepID=A0A0D3BUP4_BRAOL|nr:hypothetical protein F2Q69_00012647 [Brassica cretica]
MEKTKRRKLSRSDFTANEEDRDVAAVAVVILSRRRASKMTIMLQLALELYIFKPLYWLDTEETI